MAQATLSEQELNALRAFACAHGRQWKKELINVYWYNARIWRDANGDTDHGTRLHELRNRLGAAWLIGYCLPRH